MPFLLLSGLVGEKVEWVAAVLAGLAGLAGLLDCYVVPATAAGSGVTICSDCWEAAVW